jgi:3-hydroxybutyryl-CoA dehydrogenase
MTKGVNYPKGLLAWADELGLLHILNILEDLYEEYGEDRYRPCVLLKRMVAKNERFYV